MTSGFKEVIILNDFGSLTGGSSAVAIASARALAARGIAVTYFCAIGPVDETLRGVPRLKVVCLDQLDIAKDPRRLSAMARGIVNRTAVEAVRALLATKRPETTLVHAHTYTKALSAAALTAASELGFRLVLTLHDFFISCPTGGLFVHPSQSLCHRRPMSAGCITCHCDRQSYLHKLYRVARTFSQNRLLGLPRRVDHFVGVSEHSLGLMRPFLPKGARTSLIRNPVDYPPVAPARVEANRNFLFIGRFEREKGVLLFAEAMHRAGLPAVFVGDGSLKEEAKKRCPSGRFTGWLPPDLIRNELRQARAIVFPPLWYETLGLVVIEAAAAGVPALVAGKSAATENVRHEKTGLHFSHGSVDDLILQARKLAWDRSYAAGLGRAAFDWYWKEPWSSDRHADALLGLYESLAGGERPIISTPLAA